MNDNKDAAVSEARVGAKEPGRLEFVPETDFAKELWELRQRAVAEGMTLLTGEEISARITTDRER